MYKLHFGDWMVKSNLEIAQKPPCCQYTVRSRYQKKWSRYNEMATVGSDIITHEHGALQSDPSYAIPRLFRVHSTQKYSNAAF